MRSNPRETGLWKAVFSNDVAATKRLLEHSAGIQVNLVHPLIGTTIIGAAAEEYYNEAMGSDDHVAPPQREGGRAYRVLELLLRHGADANEPFFNKATGNIVFPMTSICAQGLVEGTKLFVTTAKGLDVMAPGACVNPTPEGGVLWPLPQAIAQGHDDAALHLIRHSSFDAGRDSRVLIVAAEADSVRVVTELLALPGSRRVLNLSSKMRGAYVTPLVAACYSGHSCVQALIDAGADVLANRQGQRPDLTLVPEPDAPRLGMTPMACAVATGADPLLIGLLVSAGAHRPTIIAPDGSRKTPLFIGRDGRKEEIVDIRTLRSSSVISVSSELKPRSPNQVATRPSEVTGLADSRFDKYVCAACRKPPTFGTILLRCGRCKKASYCDAACQKSHWKEHKRTCISTETRAE